MIGNEEEMIPGAVVTSVRPKQPLTNGVLPRKAAIAHISDNQIVKSRLALGDSVDILNVITLCLMLDKTSGVYI